MFSQVFFLPFQVVVVFYAAIILILVGTNIHRFRRSASATATNGDQGAPKQQVVVRLDHREKAYQVSASPDEIKAEVENQETDGAVV